MSTPQTNNAYPGWEELQRDCDIIEGLSPLERQDARKALHLVEDVFGSGFLGLAYAEHHAMVDYFFRRTPWNRRWLILFAKALEQLPSWQNHESLLLRLRDETRFCEAMSVLEIAYKFSTAGFTVFVDAPVKVGNKPKKPDLRIEDGSGGTELFVEVSVQYQSQSTMEAHRTSNAIFFSLLSARPSMHYSGRIFKNLAPPHLEEVQGKVQYLVQEFRNDEGFRELLIPGVIELAVASDHGRNTLENWARPRGLSVDDLSGPSFDNNQIPRIKSKIRNELQQLPPGHPNILVVENNSLFAYPQDAIAIANELEEEVYRYSHLLLMVLCGRGFGKGEDVVVEKDTHLLIQRSKFGSLVECQMLLLNRFCEPQVSSGMVERLQAVFRDY